MSIAQISTLDGLAWLGGRFVDQVVYTGTRLAIVDSYREGKFGIALELGSKVLQEGVRKLKAFVKNHPTFTLYSIHSIGIMANPLLGIGMILGAAIVVTIKGAHSESNKNDAISLYSTQEVVYTEDDTAYCYLSMARGENTMNPLSTFEIKEILHQVKSLPQFPKIEEVPCL